jgi:hypothetical protein
MVKKRRPVPEFKKKSYLDASQGWPFQFQSLSDCVLEIFKDANPKRLGKWLTETGKETRPEPILFMAMVCGMKFRIEQPDVTKALEDLWKWMTWGDPCLDKELAEILIEVLAPQMARVIEARGYKRGWPKGEYIIRKGRPPVSRGAWVAAFLTEKYLRNMGIKATTANKQAADFASVLMGRKSVELREYYRLRKNSPKSNIDELTERLIEEYNHWVRQDRLRADSEEQNRHESLSTELKYVGFEAICGAALGRIPANLWQPFWNIQPAKPRKSKLD